MDYTKQEFRPLIYKDKEDIEEFDINDEKSIDAVMLKQIEGSVIIELDGANEYILDIFNNAHYITTLIMMEKHPVHFFRNYITIAEHAGSAYYDINEKNTYHQYFSAFTMGMVHNFLRMLDDKYNESNNIFINTLTKHFNRLFNSTGLDSEGGSLFFEIIAQIHKLKEYHIDKQSFTPRIIDKQAISDAEEYFGQKFSSWDMLIKNYGFKSSEEFAKKICRTDEEVNLLTETISLEKGSHYVKTGEEIIDPDEKERLQARIAELERELSKQKAENEELKAENEALKKQLAECSSTACDIEEDEQKTDEEILYNKVSFECFLRLLEQANCDLDNTGNKSRAGILWHMMTGKSSDELRRFCSSRAYKNNHTKADIKRLNEHLSDMDITCIRLQ